MESTTSTLNTDCYKLIINNCEFGDILSIRLTCQTMNKICYEFLDSQARAAIILKRRLTYADIVIYNIDSKISRRIDTNTIHQNIFNIMLRDVNKDTNILHDRLINLFKSCTRQEKTYLCNNVIIYCMMIGNYTIPSIAHDATDRNYICHSMLDMAKDIVSPKHMADFIIQSDIECSSCRAYCVVYNYIAGNYDILPELIINNAIIKKFSLEWEDNSYSAIMQLYNVFKTFGKEIIICYIPLDYDEEITTDEFVHYIHCYFSTYVDGFDIREKYHNILVDIVFMYGTSEKFQAAVEAILDSDYNNVVIILIRSFYHVGKTVNVPQNIYDKFATTYADYPHLIEILTVY